MTLPVFETDQLILKEKDGERLIGTRKCKFVNPDYTEAETWELLREDWFAR